MTYDSWKLANPDDERGEDPADQCTECGDHYTRCVCESGYEAADPVCLHGHDLFAHCDECEAIKLSAADGGEENDMATEEQMTGEVPWETQLRFLLEKASDLQLKAARYAVETEQKKRLEDAQATIRALDPKAPKPRARRSDAGHPRAPKAANDVPRGGDGVAV